ncbi:MAG: hypothetical protein BWK73_26305 [Thiothrix lacustris]|uniref:DOD-type homing endonuclease domain-containing protein n=1 Tax=Thiothrix lacustris TaxID=525917 RepID=A0A1Y1QKU1_9GAMM|nr:MAG: hypothetical protein BWK73_26305 [Thiothrix lacustris]
MDYCRHDCSYLAQQGRCRHQVFADYQLNWVEAGKVKRHDLIFLPRYETTHQAITTLNLLDWLPSEEYVEQNGQLHYQKATERSLGYRLPSTRHYQIPATIEVTPTLCRLIGYFSADGYANIRADGGAVQFVFHRDETAFIQDVRDSMSSCFGLTSGLDTFPENNKAIRLNFYSKPLAYVFRAWCYTSENYKRLPDWLLNLPEDCLVASLRGYWAGDGCRRSIVYEAGTNSSALAGQIRLILQRLGVVSRLHVDENKARYQSIVNGAVIQAQGTYYQIIVSGHTLSRMAELVGQPKKGELAKRLCKSHGHDWAGGYLLPIRKVTTVNYAGWVYNLETEDHSYVTAAGCVHNCDNIGYADLSDFFYVWLRKSLRPIFPGLYATLAVPKAEELVATPYRHGGKESALCFFMNGMEQAIHRLAELSHPTFPVTIYYAYKHANEDESGTASMGWSSFLEAVVRAGFAITGTWPMRTERDARSIGIGTNALASSIVLVCRQRATDAATISRREFIRELNATLPDALLDMTRGGVNSPVAPVDLSQAIIGPGMAIFSQYTAVLEADGTPMSVRTALQLINRFLSEDDFDHDTQFCLAWFDQQGWAEGKYGEADVLARAKGTSVGGLVEAGVVESASGNLRLLRWADMPRDWNPETDTRTPIWEALHQLIRALNQDGETAAGALLARMPERTESIRALAYRLYTLCERKGWATDARAYNELIGAWGGVEQASQESGHVYTQGDLGF